RLGLANQQIPNEFLGISGMDEGVTLNNTVAYSSSVLGSLISRVNYNYLSKYLFTATYRADVSSKFAPGNRTAYFPSGAFAWRMGLKNFLNKTNFIYDDILMLRYDNIVIKPVFILTQLCPVFRPTIAATYTHSHQDSALFV